MKNKIAQKTYLNIVRKTAFAGFFMAGSLAWGQTSLPLELDVIVRDFQPSHPDFENFSEESVKHLDEIFGYGRAGYDATWYGLSAYHNSCGNRESKAGVALGKDGLPWVANPLLPTYLQETTAYPGTYLAYGECSNPSEAWAAAGVKKQRGFQENAAVQFTGVQKNTCSGGMFWKNEVYYTPGMVQPYLKFDLDSTGTPLYLEGAHIQKLNDACDNVYFQQWFEDVEGINKRSNVTLNIPAAADNPKYRELDYNYNNGGYFPLDVVDAYGQWTGSLSGTNQWGPQSFSIFCPPYNYQYASTQEDYLGNNTAALCAAWNEYGGARGLTTDNAKNIATANGALGLMHLRNYNFTMMGYANFKYYEANNINELTQEIFEFAGDDDMWIFVDGVLVVDLGGTHLATPGIVNIRKLAQNNHGCHDGEPLAATQKAAGACSETAWTNGSWHHLHFFYADRQTDGSNLFIRANLSEVASSTYGQPAIKEAEVVSNDNGSFDTYIYVQTELADESVKQIAASAGITAWPILVVRKNSAGSLDTLAYQVQNFEFVQRAAKGYSYKISGKLCSDVTCSVLKNPAMGDSLAFNFPANENNLTSTMNKFNSTSNFTIYSKNNKGVDKYAWGAVTSASSGTTTNIIPADESIDRPPFDTKTLDNGELSNKQTGEIIVTPLPTDYSTAEDQNAWINDNFKKYTQVPDGNSTVDGQVVINSKTNSSTGTVTNARCSTSGGEESCVSFSFVTDQAFRVTVRVFDHLGHFVSQYSQEMSQAQFNKITGSYAPDEVCSAKEGSGKIVASVKTYPVSQDGRKLGTGAYIYQVSLVEYPQPHCVNVGGDQSFMPGEYRRTEYKQTRGFRRMVEK